MILLQESQTPVLLSSYYVQARRCGFCTACLVQFPQHPWEGRCCFLIPQRKQQRLGEVNQPTLSHQAGEHPRQPHTELSPAAEPASPSLSCCGWRLSLPDFSAQMARSPLITDFSTPEAAGLGREKIAWLLGLMPFQEEDPGRASCQPLPDPRDPLHLSDF